MMPTIRAASIIPFPPRWFAVSNGPQSLKRTDRGPFALRHGRWRNTYVRHPTAVTANPPPPRKLAQAHHRKSSANGRVSNILHRCAALSPRSKSPERHRRGPKSTTLEGFSFATVFTPRTNKRDFDLPG